MPAARPRFSKTSSLATRRNSSRRPCSWMATRARTTSPRWSRALSPSNQPQTGSGTRPSDSRNHLAMFVRKESIALLLAIATTARLQAATTTTSQLVSDKSISAAPAKSGQAIPWSQISGKAGAGYKGDGLSVTSTQSGARLRCVIQRLEGEVTTAGLWLVSTVTNTAQKRFRVVASSIERTERTSRTDSPLPAADGAHGVTRPTEILPAPGRVSVDGQIVRFIRPGVIEEYSVSMDGV